MLWWACVGLTASLQLWPWEEAIPATTLLPEGPETRSQVQWGRALKHLLPDPTTSAWSPALWQRGRIDTHKLPFDLHKWPPQTCAHRHTLTRTPTHTHTQITVKTICTNFVFGTENPEYSFWLFPDAFIIYIRVTKFNFPNLKKDSHVVEGMRAVEFV